LTSWQEKRSRRRWRDPDHRCHGPVCLKTQDIYGYRYEGTRFDCGNKVGFQMANLAFSMDRPDMRERLLPFIKTLIEK
jgi:UTP-glucose-1-phosphate uridylyltransferase